MKCGFSIDFSSVSDPNSVLTPLKSASKIRISSFVPPFTNLRLGGAKWDVGFVHLLTKSGVVFCGNVVSHMATGLLTTFTRWRKVRLFDHQWHAGSDSCTRQNAKRHLFIGRALTHVGNRTCETLPLPSPERRCWKAGRTFTG